MPYLFAAYTVMWAGLVLYALLLARRQRQLARELAALEQAIRGEGDAP